MTQTDVLAAQTPVLLSDEKVARFITDGYLTLKTDVPDDVQRGIYQKLQGALHNGENPGNNILPTVPELQQILDSPTVHGALQSVLGPNYVLHPHRFVHNNEPGKRSAAGDEIGKGSRSFIGWHQDDHSPLSRPRHHYPRYAMLLYYPQDTPEVMGPTQIIPATHLHRAISDTDRERGFQAGGSAGTCLLVHFDLAHGGSLNLAEQTRYMAKFVFTRVEEPVAPSWECRQREWQTPAGHQAPCEMPPVWSHLWNWMSGRLPCTQVKRQAQASIPDTVSSLLAAMEGEAFPRLQALYALADMGEPAVEPLCRDLAQREASHWSEGAVVMENSAYALAALGKPAVPALVGLLDARSEWVQINALFALGEMGAQAHEAIPFVIGKLANPAHAVVRTALDALGQIGAEEHAALPSLHKLLTMHHPDWQTPLRRGWTGQDQVRTNVMMALLRLGWQSEEVTQTIAAALDDPCGYVTGFGIEALRRQNTPAGLNLALTSLMKHRWDDTLRQGARTF